MNIEVVFIKALFLEGDLERERDFERERLLLVLLFFGERLRDFEWERDFERERDLEREREREGDLFLGDGFSSSFLIEFSCVCGFCDDAGPSSWTSLLATSIAGCGDSVSAIVCFCIVLCQNSEEFKTFSHLLTQHLCRNVKRCDRLSDNDN